MTPIAEHDWMCPRSPLGLDIPCQCDLIARVRADEREGVTVTRYPNGRVRNIIANGTHWVPVASANSQEDRARRTLLAALRVKVEGLRDVYERRTALHQGQAYVLPEPKHTYDERTIRAVLALLDED